MTAQVPVVVLVSADFEWEVTCRQFPAAQLRQSPLGQWFVVDLPVQGRGVRTVFMHGGWGKIAAAASTEYAIQRWQPALLVNLGTCGGFAGLVEKGQVVLVERTVVYDIIEQMGDFDTHIAHYTTDIDLSWLGDSLPHPVLRTLIVSGDRDLVADEIPLLHDRYGAVVGDWESGAIAWVAARHGVRCLILRGVSDLVGPSGGEAYDGNVEVFRAGTAAIMPALLRSLPDWLALAVG